MPSSIENRLFVTEGDAEQLIEDLSAMGWAVIERKGRLEIERGSRPSVADKLSALARALQHDVAAPARAVKLIAELVVAAKGDVSAELTGHLPLYADSIVHVADRFATYVRCLHERPAFTTVEVQDIIDEAIGRLPELARRSIRRRQSAPITLPAARGFVITALRELLCNAARFSAGVIAIEVDATDASVSIVVADDGPGMDPASIDVAFELGRRLHVPAGPPTAGVGLAICRHVADIHGGRIDVETSPSHGSRFALVLPRGRRSRKE